ncbi:type IX secretion system protein PorD [Phaeocystidibacter luteus]|uniref:DUF4835 family protein n=1 Tax=Phaeocystidibacter luteus TaxID=911197 RepID=A0A6N6RLM3_9FLAO|nr:DUF4835 family protein [Phaeocystidibacter luteus]KAB2814473.1 DUF4835 family protein [Phaeocystidibacter luteus]
MLKKAIALIAVFFTALSLQAQEIQATVRVTAPSVQITDKSIFTNLETRLTEFMNGRKWTELEYQPEERITCTFVFVIDQYDQQSGRFSGQLQLNYSRPIYNSTYQSPVLNWIDPYIQFTYVEGSPIDYVENQHLSNLTSILAFYAYVFIGLDHDTYAPGAGEPFYVKAQTITAAAQNDNSATGWRSFDSNRNRYWMVDNLLNPAFDQVSNTLYQYHRLGLDKMYDQDQQEAAKQAIKNSLMALKDVYQRRPGSFLIQLFMEAKSDEIISIFSNGPSMQVSDLVEVLQQIDGPRSSDYDAILQAGN